MVRRPEQLLRHLNFKGSRTVVFGIFACLLVFSIISRLRQQSFVRILPSVSHFELVTPQDQDASAYLIYKSSPITPPHLNITRYDGELADGLLFLTPRSRQKKMRTMKAPAPYIFTRAGDLVYAHNRTNLTVNMRMQEIDSEAYLTFWQGPNVGGYGYGRMFTLNSDYRQSVVKLDYPVQYELGTRLGVPGLMDFHEQKMTDRGTLIVTGYSSFPMDLSHLPNGNKDGTILDSMFFEIDIKTGKTIFSWSAAQHISLTDSPTPIPLRKKDKADRPWDFFHINSIHDLEEGYLISSRHYWSIFLISKKDGHIIWQLDGRGIGGDFGHLAENSQFQWQHHVRAHNVTKDRMEISLFDNHCTKDSRTTIPSRGLLLEIKLPPDPTQEPKLLKDVRGPEIWYVDSQGSYDAYLSNGNQLIGFGTVPVVQEYGPAGDLRWEARFGVDFKVMSYRAYKKEWHATPYWDPSLVLEEDPVDDRSDKIESVTAYVSWSGATDVDLWGVYVGSRAGGSRLTAKATKKGFETSFRVRLGDSECVQVSAWKASEEVRFSNKVCIGDEPITFPELFDEEYTV